MLLAKETQYLEGKKAIVMSVSPGGGGALKAREQVAKLIGYAKAEIVGQLSLPAFRENFVDGALLNNEIKRELDELLAKL